ncbi:MAG TPA: tetratricopeptide repeat protein [Pyrinomonadaceae bacterium]|nr:tetratricopeptide repeat protein [Pyrinomonadaceae bacterium]
MNPTVPDLLTKGSRIILLCIALATAVAGSNARVLAQNDDNPSDQAIELFNKGQDAHEKGDLKLAIENYEKALKLIPNFPEAELQRGSAYQSLGKFMEAETAFRHAVELRDDWSLAMASLGSVLVRQQRYADAERHLTKAIEIDDMNFPAYAALTELRLRTNASPEVLNPLLNRLRTLTSKANPTASIWASRAAIENSLGDRKSAKASAAKALEIDPKSLFALSTAADIAIFENDPSAAEGFIKRLEAIAPKSETTTALRIRVLLSQGKIDDAMKAIDSIQSPGPEIVDLKKQIQAATTTDTADLEKQLAADPKNATALARLCSAYRTSDPTKALDYCRRASEVSPNDVQPVIGYAAALVQAKSYSDAVTVLRKLLTIAPENTTVHANLATALFQMQRYAEAKIEFRWLTEHQPDQAIGYYFLGIVHDKLAEFPDAAANYQQFLRIADPESSKLEIEKVNLRLPAVLNLIKEGKGKKRG